MTEKIKPALSAEEWREVLEALAQPVVRGEDGEIDTGARITPEGELEVHDGFSIITSNVGDSPLGRLALLNHALPDEDPRKITPHMVEAMRQCAGATENDHGPDDPIAAALATFADALESYLPPSTKSPVEVFEELRTGRRG